MDLGAHNGDKTDLPGGNGVPIAVTGNHPDTVELNKRGVVLPPFQEKKGYDAAKRLFDIVFATAAIIFFLPLMVLIALFVKLDSKGPLLFKQTRIGQNRRRRSVSFEISGDKGRTEIKGKPITIYKFRTMRVDTHPYAVSPKDNKDRRITRVGRILRPLCLDELPQLFLVLNGALSLVGPRPEMPFIVEKYGSLEAQRLLVKPGITGIWQLKGSRTKFIHEELNYDLDYIRNRSLWLDFKLMIQTLLFVFSFKNL